MRCSLAIVLVAACGGSDAILALDADLSPDSAPFVPGPNTVTLDVSFQPPFFVRYRDGNGPWTTAEPITPTRFELHITDAYDAMIACGDPSGAVDSQLIRRTFSDGAAAVACISIGYAPPSQMTVGIAGRMEQPGTVFFGDVVTSETGPWTFSLQTTPGVHDLIAVGSTSMAIRRDETVEDGGMIAPIDLAASGTAMAHRSFSVNARLDEVIASELRLVTAHETATMAGTPNNLTVPPPALLQSTDTMQARITASSDTTSRTTLTPFTGQSSFSLMPVLDEVAYSFGGRKVSVVWSALPSCTSVSLQLYSRRASQGISVSRRWLDTTGTNHLALDAFPPDYNPHWLVDLSRPYLRDFTARDESDDTANHLRTSSRAELVNDDFAAHTITTQQRLRREIETRAIRVGQ